MRPYTVGEIAQIVGGTIVSGYPETSVTGVGIDSRKVRPGDLFCAIKGERADGHDFITDVAREGARAALIEREVTFCGKDGGGLDACGKFSLIRVESTLGALAALAKAYREELSTRVIGITGSVGKTSTKDAVHSVLNQKYRTYKNPGNLNSHIGLPLAILGMDPGYDYAVLEMAMRARGEIADLCRIAGPELGVLTDISHSHIGLLGSLEQIALSKAELLESLPQDGLAVLCGDNPRVRAVSSFAKCRVIFYGLEEENDCRAFGLQRIEGFGTGFTAEYRGSRYEFSIPLFGKHQVQNALAAVVLGFDLGLSYEEIKAGLLNISLSPMRQEIIRQGSITIINDAYNASVKSMKAALDLLAETGTGRKVAILGDMLELGDFAPLAHREVGDYARGKVDVLLAVGNLARFILEGFNQGETVPGTFSSLFPDKTSAGEYLKGFVEPGDVLLVKASRGMGFESLVELLKEIGSSLPGDDET